MIQVITQGLNTRSHVKNGSGSFDAILRGIWWNNDNERQVDIELQSGACTPRITVGYTPQSITHDLQISLTDSRVNKELLNMQSSEIAFQMPAQGSYKITHPQMRVPRFVSAQSLDTEVTYLQKETNVMRSPEREFYMTLDDIKIGPHGYLHAHFSTKGLRNDKEFTLASNGSECVVIDGLYMIPQFLRDVSARSSFAHAFKVTYAARPEDYQISVPSHIKEAS